MFSTFIENLCFGMRPRDFIRQEFTLNSTQKRTAKRIFFILLLFSIIAVSTRLPGNRVTAFFLAILLPQMILSSRMALDAMKLLTSLILVSVTVGLATVILFADQGWFRYPFAIGIIVLLMFHARKSRLSNIIPIFYSNIALYNTANPVAEVDSGLWNLLILGGAIVVAASLIAFVLWPTSALDVFRERIRTRLTETLGLLESLVALPPGSLPPTHLEKARHTSGWMADTLKHLDDAIRDQPDFQEGKGYWIESVMELDNLGSGLTDFQRLWLAAEPQRALTAEESTLIKAIYLRLKTIERLFESRGERGFDEPVPQPPPLDHSGLSPLLIRQFLSVDRLLESLRCLYRRDPMPLEAQLKPVDASIWPMWLTNAYWRENQAILLWSLKVGIACAIVTLLILSMNAGDVDTAILTTIIVADSTLGADVRKSIMRLTGALFGALLGYLWLILGQPVADTIAGFLVTLAPFLLLCAWAGATSPRLNYAGLQIGLAFSMTVFSEFEPGTYLGTGWYRILGILLGISVMGVVDYFFWPAKSVDMARLRLIQTLSHIRDNLRRNPGRSDLNLELSVATLRVMDSNLKDAVYFLDFARMEPGSSQPKHRQIVSDTSALIQAMTYLSKIIESRHRLFLERRMVIGKTVLGELQTPMKTAYADEYDAQVHALIQKKRPRKGIDLEDHLTHLIQRMEALEAFRNTTPEERRYIDALLDLERKHVRALLKIRDLIEESLTHTEQSATQPALSPSAFRT
ncbi:MAG: hypothetical protein RL333_406 [Pseudomonadota bacterium]|jgi:multidrug resistance protein MdtO